MKRTMVEEGSWTVYVGGIYEKRSNGTYVKYYSALGRRIAMRDNTGVVHYVLADHLGSSTVVTNSAGGVDGTMKYYPYGAQRSVTGDMITDKLFTGQQLEPEGVSALGLYNYGARFYSTLMGRFVSPDPFVPDASDVAKLLGPALMVTLPSGFSGRGGDSVYGPVVGLMGGDHTTGLYVYVPPDDDVSPGWPAEGFMPRQDLLDPDDLNADYAPAGPDEPSGWPKDTVAPNPQPLNRFAYVLNNPLRYTDPTGYWCPGCGWIADQTGKVGGFFEEVAGGILCNAGGCNVAEFATGVGLGVVGLAISTGGLVLLVNPLTAPAGYVLLEVAIPIELAALVLMIHPGCITVVY